MKGRNIIRLKERRLTVGRREENLVFHLNDKSLLIKEQSDKRVKMKRARL